jgi:electron-transferring-flavoprotein dehydrogenase
MQYDVVIVGAGPSGLSAAIRLKQLAPDLSVCVVEKGSEVGAHLLSGACFEPRALNELIPDWKDKGAPLKVPVTDDRLLLLTESSALPLPVPPQMHNEGNFVISLGELAKWLAGQAEAMGVEIYPGFAAAEILYDDNGAVRGIATGDIGIGKHGEKTGRFQRGVELHARQTIFAEGARGSLTKAAIAKFGLAEGRDPQHYSLGVKELWEIQPEKHKPGHVTHTIGWPMDAKTYGGSWLYHFENNLVSIGFVVALDYENPTLSPFQEMQRFKTHPAIKPLLEGGRRVSYGARVIVTGGVQSLPKLAFPGGCLIGDCAGFLNVPKIKGNHTAMKSGMICAEVVAAHLSKPDAGAEVLGYQEALEKSWLWHELWRQRNVKPAFKWGLWASLVLNAIDTYVFRGRAPWTLHSRNPDHLATKKLAEVAPITYPKPDGVISFDRLSSVFLSNTNHEEDQPAHLRLTDPSLATRVNLAEYGGPEQFYCPAGVYEFVAEGTGKRLQINAQNCVHCKTCDIKDPEQNITWTVPEGGGGPNYPNM